MLKAESCLTLNNERNLDKYLSQALKSVGYLELVIFRSKVEIIPSSVNILIDAILDLYNSLNSKHKKFRLQINFTLAKLVEYADNTIFSPDDDYRKIYSQNLIVLLKKLARFLIAIVENEKIIKTKFNQNYSIDTESKEDLRKLKFNENNKAIASDGLSQNLNISLNENNYSISHNLTNGTNASIRNDGSKQDKIHVKNDYNTYCSMEKLNLNLDNLATEFSKLHHFSFADEKLKSLLEKLCQETGGHLEESIITYQHTIEHKSTVIKRFSYEINERKNKSTAEIHHLGREKLKTANINKCINNFLNNQNSCPSMFISNIQKNAISNIYSFSYSNKDVIPNHSSIKCFQLTASVTNDLVNFNEIFDKQNTTASVSFPSSGINSCGFNSINRVDAENYKAKDDLNKKKFDSVSNSNIVRLQQLKTEVNGSCTSSSFQSSSYTNENQKTEDCNNMVYSNEGLNGYSKFQNELDLMYVNDYIEYQKNDLQSKDLLIRGGSVNALIVLATDVDQKESYYQKAFLLTYRTILEPTELIYRLLYRFRKFNLNSNELVNKKIAKSSFSLVVQVIEELNYGLTNDILKIFETFVVELILNDELNLARIIRKKIKSMLENKFQNSQTKIVPLNVKEIFYKKDLSLFDFKSVQIAEQMTLIDQNLFFNIGLSELLLWSTKRSKDSCQNLLKFTKHFNSLSYWTRSRLLEQKNSQERDKCMEKFFKIMKWLKQMCNFNSYIAILSGLQSAPIQRLEWSKNILDTIQEFSVLMEPSCGFKRLKEIVSKSQPPCIPFIGLILQDLTILDVANPDFLPSGKCNFWKRWQQVHILERLKCFRNCKIKEYFDDFSNFINEETQYEVSEEINKQKKKLLI